MIFGPTKSKEPLNINVSMEGEKLEIVRNTKFLGIILDDQLNWKLHIAYLAQKLSKSVGILSRARQLLSSNILKQLYYSFLYPYITYCNIIWGQAPSSTLWPLFKTQKRAIRIICNIRQRDSTSIASKKLRILRLPDIHTFSILNFMYKFNNGLLPETFNFFFLKNENFHRYPTSSAAQLRTPKAKSRVASSFINKTGATLWNTFSPQLTNYTNMKSFKQELISLLISKY
jgi:hypothetical protein